MSLLIAAAILSCCQAVQTADEPIPHVVTADIQAGIEHYIDEQTRLGDGYFSLPFEDKVLKLKLVRVHTEYLATLGPRRHFACIDLVSTDGNVYDVDFFLAGDPGHMTITETTVHKLNGKPYYLWEQADDGTWHHVDADDASRKLLGVIEGTDHFEFLYHVTLPTIEDHARMWIPLPSSDRFQSINIKKIKTPGSQRILTDKDYGNKILYIEFGPEASGQTVEFRAEVVRHEKSIYRDDSVSPARFLLPERSVPINDEFREIAAKVLKDKKGQIVRARALYDQTIEHMRYAKFGDDYGKGDAVYACDAGNGNCTDYHSYFIALARASGIPARFAIGAAIPANRDDGGVNGYHCWAEFYADGQWWPVDISEADKFTSLSTYYFGHNPANRIELSKGRDLVVEPGPASGPINFLAYPVLEVAGKPVKIKPKFGFTRLPGGLPDASQANNTTTQTAPSSN